MRGWVPFCLLVTGCSAVLGLRDIGEEVAPIDEPPLEEDGGPGQGRDAGSKNEAGTLRDGGTLPFDAGDQDAGLVDCLGTLRAVFFCDGFEATTIATPPWTVTQTPSTAAADFGSTSNFHVTGTRSAGAHTETGSGTLTATGRWDRPGGEGKLAFQFSVFLPNDSWVNTDVVPIAAITGGGQRAELMFKANGSGADGSLELKRGGSSIDLGTISENTWNCIEIVDDNTNVSAFRGTANKGSFVSTGGLGSAEIGIATTLPTKTFYYDDVVFAPAAVGCLH